jgi:hypothetical protein
MEQVHKSGGRRNSRYNCSNNLVNLLYVQLKTNGDKILKHTTTKNDLAWQQ